ncbi:MAG: TonB-dependent receptor [Alphaproteobacteria bacterium]|nr:TonB-dependent receptor [Alphaproteobacteria bacterium]
MDVPNVIAEGFGRFLGQRWRVLACLSLLVCIAIPAKADEVNFNIPPQSLSKALLAFSEQARVQLIVAVDVRRLPRSPGVKGVMDARQALDRLTQGTGLEYHFSSENTVTIRRRAEDANIETEEKGTEGQLAIEPIAVAPSAFEEIISVGTRMRSRTAAETPVPVDVISGASLSATGQSEIGRALQSVLPSFNFSSSSVSDGTDALRPATLRGLGPDQTLVLLGGKRRHTSALVHVNTSVGRGATGTDMNAVPAIALDRVEVLRDGASAQYGSDAIAGVISLSLKRGSEGQEFSVYRGATYEGDGDVLAVASSVGLPLKERGFVRLSAEYRDRGATNRAGLSAEQQYFGVDGVLNCAEMENAQACYDPREYEFDRRNFRIGDADSEQVAVVLNAELPIASESLFYAFSTYSNRDNISAGFYRRVTQVDRTVEALYPDGFLPLIETEIEDVSSAFGVRGVTIGGFDADIGINYGRNRFDYAVRNSLNASLGITSPTEADAGGLFVSQAALVGNFVKEVPGKSVALTLAFGGELRRERFSIREGDTASYADGGAYNEVCPACTEAPVRYQQGFQVFRGFSPENALDEARDNLALYGEVDASVANRFVISAAARFEAYGDFGSKITGKLAGRAQVLPAMSIRASVSSGFRAPSIQQKYFNSISTQFVEIDGASVAQERGTYRNDSEIAGLLGVPELNEETSYNLSAGVVFARPHFTLSADVYRINIKDRIAISSAIDIAKLFPDVRDRTGITNAQFFMNAADTHTKGLDVVASYDWQVGEKSTLEVTAAATWTSTRVVKESITSSIRGRDIGPLFSRQDISILEDWQPKSRASFGAIYRRGGFSLIARANRYGEYTVCEGACDRPVGEGQNVQTFSPKWLVDLQASYLVGALGVELTVGVNNLFDTYPDRNLIGQAGAGVLPGIIQSDGVFTFSRRAAPFGFNGGLWYVRAGFQF